jgi:hypothetical protein
MKILFVFNVAFHKLIKEISLNYLRGSFEEEIFDLSFGIQRFDWALGVSFIKILHHFPFVLVSML